MFPFGQRRHCPPELVIRGEHPWRVSRRQAMPMLPRRRHEIGEPVEELTRGERDNAVGHARVEVPMMVERRAEAVQEGDAAEPCAGSTRRVGSSGDTRGRDSDRRWKPPRADGVRPPLCCNGESLGRAIRLALDSAASAAIEPVIINPAKWGTGSYSPTRTITSLWASSHAAPHSGRSRILRKAAATASVKPLAAARLRSAYQLAVNAYSASAASPKTSLAIESGLSPDAGLHILQRGGLHATRVTLRRPPLNFSEPFGAEGGPVLGVLFTPHRVNKPQTFCRAQRPRGVYDFLKRWS